MADGKPEIGPGRQPALFWRLGHGPDLPTLRGTSPMSTAASNSAPDHRWLRLLNRYHWFVLIVAALGWLFDCLDQQLFNLARKPALD